MDFKVGDIMQVNVRFVAPDMLLSELERALLKDKVGGFPVVADGELMGLVSRSDIVKQLYWERDLAESISDFYFDETGFHEIVSKSYDEIASQIGDRLESLTVKDVMARRLHTASADWPLDQLARLFTQHRIHRVPVTDAGRLMGIVTTMDLARLFADRRVETVRD